MIQQQICVSIWLDRRALSPKPTNPAQLIRQLRRRNDEFRPAVLLIAGLAAIAIGYIMSRVTGSRPAFSPFDPADRCGGRNASPVRDRQVASIGLRVPPGEWIKENHSRTMQLHACQVADRLGRADSLSTEPSRGKRTNGGARRRPYQFRSPVDRIGGVLPASQQSGKTPKMRNCHTLNVLLAIPRWAPNLLQKIGIWMVHRANSAGTFLTQRKQIMAKQNTFGVSQPLEQIYSSTLSIALFVVTIVCTLSGCDAPRSIVPELRRASRHAGSCLCFAGARLPGGVVGRTEILRQRNTTEHFTRNSGEDTGQNELRIDIYGTNNTNVGRETTLDDKPLRESDLFPEAQEALPGVPLRLSLNYVQNKYGPFGYALGTSPQGDNCVYAWQRIATSEIDISLFNRRATISIRLRLCEPHATEAALIAPMMNLDINASLSSGSWTPEPKQLYRISARREPPSDAQWSCVRRVQASDFTGVPGGAVRRAPHNRKPSLHP